MAKMIIKGERIILRPIVLADAPRFLQWVNDPETNKLTFAGKKSMTLEEEKKYIKALQKKEKAEKHFAIDTKEGVHIGSTSFYINAPHKSAMWGILIGDKSYWGRRYGTETLQLMLRHGFTKLKLHRIELHVYEYNARAIALYTKAGFVKEGVLRKAVYYKGKFYDKIVMGMLRDEWENRSV